MKLLKGVVPHLEAIFPYFQNIDILKGVLPHLTAYFPHFQNTVFLKFWSNSDQNLFTELKNIDVKYFCEIFEKYLECRVLHFSYIKSMPKMAKKRT